MSMRIAGGRLAGNTGPLLLTLGWMVTSLGVTALAVSFGSTDDFELLGIPTANRTINQLTAVVLTCMALIVPLTSNLYTPKLVQLYVTHPLIVAGLTVLVGSNLLLMTASFFPETHWLAPTLYVVIGLLYLLILSATLPFLYAVSQFLRPGYFLPLLTRSGIRHLRRMTEGSPRLADVKGLFGTIDVVTNIALTGMNRSDRQLVLLALKSLNELLVEIIQRSGPGRGDWRRFRPCFVPGLAREGQDYLTREQIWPEAYVLAQMLKVMEVVNKRQHEILGELCSQLVTSARLACEQDRDPIVELHVMALNTLMREAIDERDLRRFQNVSYHYRILIESFTAQPIRLQRDAFHLLHYGQLAAKQGLGFGLETVVYDMGELVLSIGRRDEPQALILLDQAAGQLFRQCISGGGAANRIGWRTLIRLYWEARCSDLDALAARVHQLYLGDENAHREQIERALGENRELHFEFNDRLMRFAYLSPPAESLARAFARQG